MLTFGRLVPSGIVALIFGWASLGVLAVALTQLGQSSLTVTRFFHGALGLWNLALLLSVGSILAGRMSWGFETGLPGLGAILLLLAYPFLAMPAYLALRRREQTGLFAASWFLLAGLLFFPLILLTGSAFLIWFPVSGTAQGPIEAWFVGSLINLWMVPAALGGLFFLVPQITGQRLASYNLTPLGFCLFSFFGAWSGLSSLMGGPVPVWLMRSGEVASLLLGVPVLIFSVNLLGALRGVRARDSVSLRFARPAIGSFLLYYAGVFLLALPSVSGVLQFTDMVAAQNVAMLIGVVSLTLFACVYYWVPRPPGAALIESRLVQGHYALTLVGFSGMYASLAVGGMLQGFAFSDAGLSFQSAASYAEPFRILAFCFAGILLAGLGCFAGWFFQLVAPFLKGGSRT